jgi:hypothetical protein
MRRRVPQGQASFRVELMEQVGCGLEWKWTAIVVGDEWMKGRDESIVWQLWQAAA